MHNNNYKYLTIKACKEAQQEICISVVYRHFFVPSL